MVLIFIDIQNELFFDLDAGGASWVNTITKKAVYFGPKGLSRQPFYYNIWYIYAALLFNNFIFKQFSVSFYMNHINTRF